MSFSPERKVRRAPDTTKSLVGAPAFFSSNRNRAPVIREDDHGFWNTEIHNKTAPLPKSKYLKNIMEIDLKTQKRMRSVTESGGITTRYSGTAGPQ